VRVVDSGVGIPRDMLPRVFDMFVQVGRSLERSQGGLGIGLTLVRGLVDMHGGSVEAASAGPGEGATFTIRLPLAQADAPSAPESTGHGDPGQRRILVVDDNVDAAESLAMLLELDGHVTQIAASGEEALEAAPGFQPDTVFLDIGLPRMNGYEVARRLRADPRMSAGLRLIALTGWGSEDDRRKAQEAGFDRHLVKPVDPEGLAQVLAFPAGITRL
jgi:CheY-like chemotaxis protein